MPVLWPPDEKNWLIGKDPDARKDRRQEEKGTAEDEMVGWHHGLNGHEFEQALGVGDGQGSLACCSVWGRKESNTTEWLNWSSVSHMPGFLLIFHALSAFIVRKPEKETYPYYTDEKVRFQKVIFSKSHVW